MNMKKLLIVYAKLAIFHLKKLKPAFSSRRKIELEINSKILISKNLQVVMIQ